MANGFYKTSATTPNQILFCTNPYMAAGIVVSNSGVSADSNGRKIIKAGTPVTGSLKARNTAFTLATTSDTSDAVGVILHDVDVTDGNANAELLIHGYVNINNLDSDVKSLITSSVEAALKHGVTFLA